MGLFDGFTDPSGNTEKGYDKAGKQYKSAKKGFRRTMRQTNPLYRQMMRSGQRSNNLLSDYLGLNGTDNQQAAYDSYMTGPGFDFEMDNGIRALDASAAARGGLYSGKNMMAQQKFGQGLYAGRLNDYLNRLGNQTQVGMQGAQGITGNRQALNNYKIGQGQMAIAAGQAADAGNQAALGNFLGMAGTGLSFAMGLPRMGGTGSASTPQMPTYTNGRINPWATY